MIPLPRTLMTLACAGSLALATPAFAGDENPYAKPDDTWISVSGTVGAVSPDTFSLDYGEGVINVEMDDGDRDADAYKLLEGDKVVVSGIIDDGFFELRTIEASTVYVEKLGTTFYASARDEEDADHALYASPVVVVSSTYARGHITEVDDDEFVIDTGARKLRVEVDEMPYNPLDDEGYQKLEKGDRVLVYGHIDDDLFEGRELVASSVVTLRDKQERNDDQQAARDEQKRENERDKES